MTSFERKEARYHRRKARREEKRRARVEAHNFERVIDPQSLYKAARESRKAVYWKASVQRYWMNILRNVFQTHKDLEAGKDIRRGFIEFDICERGKARHIRSVHFSERVVQKSLCNNALIPHLLPGLIHDNGASIKDKGIHFAIKRLKTHLRRHFRKHGREGYVLLVDFRKYFDNIRHEPMKDIFTKAFGEDERLVDLSMGFIYAFGDNGLGLGSETSQISAVKYSSGNDHYAKEVLRCKYYGRYMDDSYFICESKEEARRILSAMLARYEALGITASPNKTAIVKLTRGFTFLKTHFSITETGRIVARPNRKSITRQRRKLKKFKKFHAAGKMSMHEIRNSYMSWRGYVGQINSRRSIRSMDQLYKKLFGCSPWVKHPKPQQEVITWQRTQGTQKQQPPLTKTSTNLKPV